MNDELIVDLFFERNETALNETQAKYSNKLLRISQNILKNHSEAEECENDTYLSAWNSIPPHSPKQYLFAYLAKIIRNLSLNLYKKNHRQKRNATIVELSSEMEQCIPAPDDFECTLSQEEFSNMMNRFLHGIREIDCNIFLLRYWHCEPISDIAKRLRMSEGTIKSTLFRTRSKLKQYLETEGYNL